MNRDACIEAWLNKLDAFDAAFDELGEDWRETSPGVFDPDADACGCGMCLDCDDSDPGVRR